jgi:hypothetical protein
MPLFCGLPSTENPVSEPRTLTAEVGNNIAIMTSYLFTFTHLSHKTALTINLAYHHV